MQGEATPYHTRKVLGMRGALDRFGLAAFESGQLLDGVKLATSS